MDYIPVVIVRTPVQVVGEGLRRRDVITTIPVDRFLQSRNRKYENVKSQCLMPVHV